MKKISIPVCFAAFLAFGSGCNNNAGSDSATADSAQTSTSSTTEMTDTATNNTAGAAAAGAGTAASSADTSMAGDKAFITDAASGGLMEVELGKATAVNAASAKVKTYGKMMVTDHTKANTELKAVAASKNVTVPATPAQTHQEHIDMLKAKKGAEFDQAYVDMMVDDHKEDVRKFTEEVSNGKDPDVKAFASKTLPVLKKHLAAIEAIQAGMKK